MIVVADVETTGDDPAVHRVCEVALVWLAPPDWHRAGQAEALCRVGDPMDPRARAAHHLHPASLLKRRPIAGSLWRHWRADVVALAAHNAPFDAGFLRVPLQTIGATLPPLLCTWQCARHLWPTAPAYGLQVLRYWLDLPVRPPARLHPHRAMYDTLVCVALLRRMLMEKTVVELVELTTRPVRQTVVRFGQHRGSAWHELPLSYLRWMEREVRAKPDAFDADARWTLEHELKERA